MFDVSIRDLEVFYHVAAKSSFSAAADDLYITQSSVSKIILRLEKRLGVRLLARDSHNVSLTPVGERLFIELKGILPQLHHLSTQLEILGAVVHENICLTMPLTICSRLALDFAAQHPSFQIQVRQNFEPYSAYSSLLKGTAALWFVPTFVLSEDYLGHLHCVHLHDDPVYVLLPKESPLSGRASISLQEIKDEKFICHSEHINLLLKTLSIKFGLRLNVVDKRLPPMSRTSCLIDILSGKGLSVFYKSDFELLDMQNVVAVMIEECRDCAVAAVYLKERTLLPFEEEMLQYFVDSWPLL